MSEAVTVTGTPTLTLNDGGTATYTGGSGTNALTFSYTVGATDSTVANLAITQVNLPAGATVADAAGNAADLSGALTTFSGLGVNSDVVIETLGSTSLVEVGNNYYLDNISSGTGPELKYGGAAIVAGQFGAYTPVGVEQTAGGYEVAFQNSGANQFSIWNTDSNGNFVSYSVYSGASTALESLETSFHQDLNGDGVIGIKTTVIEALGSTSLVEVGNNYYLDTISSGTGPELKYGGAAIVAGQFGAYTPVGVEQTAGGYEVALQNSGANQFSIWNTDSSGNFVSYSVYSGASTALESLETSFHQDLNGDGVIGIKTTVIEALGSTSLVEVGNNYYLDTISSGTGPELKYGGAAIVAGQFGAYTPVGVEQTAGGYEVAFQNSGANQFSIWNTDSNGNFVSYSVYSGASTALESLETSFHQDLNGDGVIGIKTTVIEALGSTSLVEVGNNYYLDTISSGTGPELKYGGAAIVAGQFGAYTPVGVEQTAGGYEVAFQNSGANQFSIWNTDSNGNFVSYSVYSGTSPALGSLETSFHQDLNGDGVVFTSGTGSSVSAGNLIVGAGASVELTGAYSGTVTFGGPTGTLKIDTPASFTGSIGGQLAIGDVIDLPNITAGAGATLAYSGNNGPGTLTVSDGIHTDSIALLGNYSLANFTASSDGNGGTQFIDPPLPTSQSASALDQQLALFSQYIASAFPTSAFSDGGPSILGISESGIGQPPPLTQPVATQQHA